MSLLALLIVLVIAAAVALWFFPNMEPILKKIVIAIPLIVFIVWVLNILGIINVSPSDLKK